MGDWKRSQPTITVAGYVIDCAQVLLGVSIRHGRSGVSVQPDAPSATFTLLGRPPTGPQAIGDEWVQEWDPTWRLHLAPGYSSTFERNAPVTIRVGTSVRFSGYVDEVRVGLEGNEFATSFVCIGWKARSAGVVLPSGTSWPRQEDATRAQSIAGEWISHYPLQGFAVLGDDAMSVGDTALTDSRSVMDLLHTLCESTGALFRQERSGRLAYESITWRPSRDPVATFDSCRIADGVEWAKNSTDLINAVRIRYGPGAPDAGGGSAPGSPGGLTQEEADARYVNSSGAESMSGPLNIGGSLGVGGGLTLPGPITVTGDGGRVQFQRPADSTGDSGVGFYQGDQLRWFLQHEPDSSGNLMLHRYGPNSEWKAAPIQFRPDGGITMQGGPVEVVAPPPTTPAGVVTRAYMEGSSRAGGQWYATIAASAWPPNSMEPFNFSYVQALWGESFHGECFYPLTNGLVRVRRSGIYRVEGNVGWGWEGDGVTAPSTGPQMVRLNADDYFYPYVWASSTTAPINRLFGGIKTLPAGDFIGVGNIFLPAPIGEVPNALNASITVEYLGPPQ